MKKFDYLVFIGRFQPLHLGHTRVIDEALRLSEKVIVLCGSAHTPRNLRNPWTYAERGFMLESVYPEEVADRRLLIAGIPDMKYRDHLWVGMVQKTVNAQISADLAIAGHWQPDGVADKKIGLIGCKKDNTSYYLDLFPTWGSVDVEFLNPLNATDIRRAIFDYMDGSQLELEDSLNFNEVFPEAIGARFKLDIHPDEDFGFMPEEAWNKLVDEDRFIRQYRESWSVAPYPPTFVATDALVIQSGHILLIERRAEPGKGLWAMPGGFLDQNETIAEGTIRELIEETKIKVSRNTLEGSVVERRVFDDPHRSMRGRMITHVSLFRLRDGKLPKVKGGDDAAKAKWVPLSDVTEDRMFSDHYHIIQAMLGEN